VDLGAIWRNLDRIARWVAPARVWAVVKADAYGHGAAAVVQAIQGHPALRGVVVARPEEARELRRLGISCPILVLSPTFQPEDYRWAAEVGVELCLSSPEQLALAEEVAPTLVQPLSVHLELDTGMTRLGLSLEQAAAAVRAWADGTRMLCVRGWMSHLAAAEEPERRETLEQLRLFQESISFLPPSLGRQLELHLANSAGALLLPASHFDAVRVGLGLYGVDPTAGRSPVLLEAAMRVVTQVALLREIPVGRGVGYGFRWRAARPARIAMVPVGYADGYSWSLGNRSWALVSGVRVPVVGSVSMDLLALEVTDVPVEVGSEVVLLGKQGPEQITVQDLAAWAGTIPYELLCRLGRRLPRRYLLPSEPTPAEAASALSAVLGAP
jgi:alanine racemase